ncbi:DUF2306 domain-containing protein [Arthrobacter sp. CAN_C5]|uniref:DUF2306 domain-containing protein n=1 Tax=Arthrobacter sp. CAN_C5 TaxID=2760706 RepID=UPI001AE21758|nr:DUF2306 domain-containing protein [Arthrobacter sp. CAN_C5]MBP2217073.1 putative membrane protein [Arthrobacter sp. CAN_C5]
MTDKEAPRAVTTVPVVSAERKRIGPLAWLLPTLLMALGLIPLLAGTLRRIALSLGAADASANGGTEAIPLPALIHILGASVYVILGALQFSRGFRRRRPAWHRFAGRVLLAAGLFVALSGLWLNHFVSFPAGSGDLLYVFRLLAGTGMAVSIVLGFSAIRRRNIPGHRKWMIRAYAIGLGAGTQVFTLGFGEALFGKSEVGTALLNGAGWAVNLTVAELAIRRRKRDRGSPAGTMGPEL